MTYFEVKRLINEQDIEGMQLYPSRCNCDKLAKHLIDINTERLVTFLYGNPRNLRLQM